MGVSRTTGVLPLVWQLSWAEKRKIIEGVARGLRHAHKSGVVHRDVRPLSVVVTPDEVVKLVNFDLARIESAPADVALENIKERLHPAYTAPEVLRDPASANQASDVYSLGILLYELITSRQPYKHVDEVIKRKKVPLNLDFLMKEFATPGSEDFMAHPKDAVDTIARMCSFDPAERYTNMTGVIEDLQIIGD